MRIDTGDTAWLLVSAALVLFMSPGLALFYAGMVRRKNVLSTLMHSFSSVPIVLALWLLCGYGLAFGPTHRGLIGGLGASGVGLERLTSANHGTVPELAFVAFQMMFAGIAPALISGAFAERMKFTTYLAFVALWSLFVYIPMAHWVWADGGWLAAMGALDFAGGAVIHITAGVSALVFAKVLGPRLKYPHERPLPHDLTMTMTGAGILWFGWFGFNAGSALSSGHLAALAFVATHLGAAGGVVGWTMVEWRHRGKPTALGVASGLVGGLVAITPAAGFVAPWAAFLIGVCAGAACYGGVLLKYRLGYDDSLDAFGVHGVGGFLGAVLTGVFAISALTPGGAKGLLEGDTHLFIENIIGVVVAAIFSAVVTYVILKVIDKTIGLRVDEEQEAEGLDTATHGEKGYLFGGAGAMATEE